jgi:hypothetical protein
VKENETMSVSEKVAAAFDEAARMQPDLRTSWLRVSVCLGGALPASTLMSSVQRDGELDLVLRCMEDERTIELARGPQGLPEPPPQQMLSEMWVGSVYESLRIVEREGAIATDDVRSLTEDFRLLRVPLEKHQIAFEKDKLSAPLTLQKTPPKGDQTDIYVYDKADPKRAHIMPTKLSTRASLMWFVTDLKTGEDRWIERRSLSERMIALFDRGPASPAS